MQETTDARSTGEDAQLQDLKERVAQWRQARQRGEHVPAELWAEAVRMAHKHGAPQVAQQLQLNLDRLRRRMHRPPGVKAPPQPGKHFVELLAGAMPATAAASVRECVVELRNAAGVTMRVELAGSGLSMLAGLCREFCSA